MTCARCEAAPAVGTFHALVRRPGGRGRYRTLTYRFCESCVAVLNGLLAPGGKLERVG